MLRILLLALTFVMALHPLTGWTQGAPPLAPPSPLPPAPGWNNAGNLTFPAQGGERRPYADELWGFKLGAKAGHQWWAYNVHFPFNSNPDPFQQKFAFERMDLELRDMNFWMGYVNAEIQPVQNIVLYGILGGNIPKSVSTVKMSATGVWTRPAAFNGGNTVSPWYWDTKFQWWMAEAGVLFWVNSIFGIEAGFHMEHADWRMTNPRNETLEIPGRVELNGVSIPCDRI